MYHYAQDITNCIAVLQAGGIILYPTDTIWAIGCDATNENAIEKIFAIKKRIDKSKIIVLVSSERDLLQYVANPKLQIFDYIKGVSKPTTVIYEHVNGLSKHVLGKDGSVAIRICEDAFCQQLLKQLGMPLVSSSANCSGKQTPLHFTEIDEHIIQSVDYVVQHRQQENSLHTPSSIIKWEKDGSISILRP
jgi:L-threonylcarbamoyladenylate synthase